MTNTLAAIIITVCTNWVSIGTYTPAIGFTRYDVQAGNLQTNTTAIIEFKGQKKEFLLESAEGPNVGERRVELPNQSIPQSWINGGRISNLLLTNRYWIVTNNVILTN